MFEQVVMMKREIAFSSLLGLKGLHSKQAVIWTTYVYPKIRKLCRPLASDKGCKKGNEQEKPLLCNVPESQFTSLKSII